MNAEHANLVTIEHRLVDANSVGGRGLSINYREAETEYGKVLVASTDRGVCYLAFSDKPGAAMKELKALYPFADYCNRPDEFQEQVLRRLLPGSRESVKLCLTGTLFQLSVWNELLKIPACTLVTYGEIAQALNKSKAYRAVGSAIGANPVAILIPCHRVIRSNGELGGYRWGLERKERLIERESCGQKILNKLNKNNGK